MPMSQKSVTCFFNKTLPNTACYRTFVCLCKTKQT